MMAPLLSQPGFIRNIIPQMSGKEFLENTKEITSIIPTRPLSATVESYALVLETGPDTGRSLQPLF